MKPLLLTLGTLVLGSVLSAKDYTLNYVSFAFEPGAAWSEISTKSHDAVRFVAESTPKLSDNAACEVIAAEIKFPIDLVSTEERSAVIAQLLGTPESVVLQKVLSRQVDFSGASVTRVVGAKYDTYMVSTPVKRLSGAGVSKASINKLQGTVGNPTPGTVGLKSQSELVPSAQQPLERNTVFFIFDDASKGRNAVIVTASEVSKRDDNKPVFLPQAASIVESLRFLPASK